MSESGKSKRQESPYLRKLRKLFDGLKENPARARATKYVFIKNFSVAEDSEATEEQLATLPACIESFKNMAEYYKKFEGEKINGYTVAIDCSIAGETPENNQEVYDLSLDLFRDDLEVESLEVPKVLMARDGSESPELFDLNTFFDICGDTIQETLRALDLGFMQDLQSSHRVVALRGGSDSEILIKDSTGAIVHDEMSLVALLYNKLMLLGELKQKLLQFSKAKRELSDARNHDARSIINHQAEFDMSADVKLKFRKIKELTAKAKSDIIEIQGNYTMTRGIEFSSDETSGVALSSTYGGHIFAKSYFQQEVVYNGTNNIISNKITTSNAPFFASEEELSSIVRAEIVEDLLSSIYRLFTAIERSAKTINTGMTGLEAISGVSYEHPGTINKLMHNSREAGVPLSVLQNIISGNILKYSSLVEPQDKPTKDESRSLKKFLQKIGMPIDISNTSRPKAERAVAARLRQLGKTLSEEYGVAYNPDPGTVALSAMRRADDVDGIMLTISTALEDCFSIIDSTGPGERED